LIFEIGARIILEGAQNSDKYSTCST